MSSGHLDEISLRAYKRVLQFFFFTRVGSISSHQQQQAQKNSTVSIRVVWYFPISSNYCFVTSSLDTLKRWNSIEANIHHHTAHTYPHLPRSQNTVVLGSKQGFEQQFLHLCSTNRTSVVACVVFNNSVLHPTCCEVLLCYCYPSEYCRYAPGCYNSYFEERFEVPLHRCLSTFIDDPVDRRRR